jgi:hypothetical protein
MAGGMNKRWPEKQGDDIQARRKKRLIMPDAADDP